MAYQIVIKKQFSENLEKVLLYLERNWSYKIAADFLIIVNRRLEQLSRHPQFGAISLKVKDVRGVLVTRHNKLYYKIKHNQVIILIMFDTRINPKKNPYQ